MTRGGSLSSSPSFPSTRGVRQGGAGARGSDGAFEGLARRIAGRADRQTSLLDSSTWATRSSSSPSPPLRHRKVEGLDPVAAVTPTSLSAGSTASCDSFVQIDDSFFSPSQNPHRRRPCRPSNSHNFDVNASLVDPYLSSAVAAAEPNPESKPIRSAAISPNPRRVRDEDAFLRQQRAIERQLQQWSFEGGDFGPSLSQAAAACEFPNDPIELQSSFLNDHASVTAASSWSPASVAASSSASPCPRAVAVPRPAPSVALRGGRQETSVSVESPDLSPARTTDAYVVTRSPPVSASSSPLPESEGTRSDDDRAALQAAARHWHSVAERLHRRDEECAASSVSLLEGAPPPPPSLASARAQLRLGNALLRLATASASTSWRGGLDVAREAQRAFQTAHRAFSDRAARYPRYAASLRISTALCMESLGAALVAEADFGAGEVEQHPQQQYLLLVRAYTVQLEAFRLRQKILGTYHVDTISALNSLANLHQRAGDDAEAQRCRWQVYWARAAVFGPDHPSCAVSAHDIGNGFVRLGALDDAHRFYQAALRVYDAMELDNDNPAVRKLLRDVKRLERLERNRGYNLR